MLRWTFSLALMATLFLSTTELQAQRRTPLRNMVRQLGHGWSSGYHAQTPGHDSSYYSPWSEQNLWQGDRPLANPPANQPTPVPPATIDEDNAAYRILPRSTASGPRQVIRNPHFQTGSSSRNPAVRSIDDASWINQHLQPYHLPKANTQAVEINHGGDFRISPESSAATTDRWHNK